MTRVKGCIFHFEMNPPPIPALCPTRRMWTQPLRFLFSHQNRRQRSSSAIGGGVGGGVLSCLERLKQHLILESFSLYGYGFLAPGMSIAQRKQGPGKLSYKKWTELPQAKGGSCLFTAGSVSPHHNHLCKP